MLRQPPSFPPPRQTLLGSGAKVGFKPDFRVAASQIRSAFRKLKFCPRSKRPKVDVHCDRQNYYIAFSKVPLDCLRVIPLAPTSFIWIQFSLAPVESITDLKS